MEFRRCFVTVFLGLIRFTDCCHSGKKKAPKVDENRPAFHREGCHESKRTESRNYCHGAEDKIRRARVLTAGDAVVFFRPR